MSWEDIEEENSEMLGLRGYQWEPEYTEEEGQGAFIRIIRYLNYNI